MKIRILVADDSVLFRKVISDALASIPDVEIVGSASNGKLALQKIREIKPDLMTLDMEMPEMDGIGVLDAIRGARENVMVIVVSALTKKGGELTMRALEKGAFDFITKPEGQGPQESLESLKRELTPRVRAIANRLEIRKILAHKSDTAKPFAPSAPAVKPTAAADVLKSIAAGKPDMVLIGVSTGGPNALAKMLPGIPRDIGVPVLIVQHMPPVFTQSLAESLSAKCAIKVREASQGEVIEPNIAYIAPGGRQMRLLKGADNRRTIQVTDDPPENNCRPAVDYLFRSVANSFPGKAMAVILTGMGSDGTIGVKLLRRHGCYTIAQDEASCVVYGMPKAVADAGAADAILPLDEIANRIVSKVRGIA